MQITNAGAEALLAAKKLQVMANRIEDLEGEILYLKGSLGKWTKEPPSKPGWYWTSDDSVAEAVDVYLDEIDNTLKVAMALSEAVFDLEDISLWWSVPISEPPKPEDKCQNTKE